MATSTDNTVVHLMLLVCFDVCDDPDPMHSLSQRLRTLTTLGSASSDMWSMVRCNVLPRMLQRYTKVQRPSIPSSHAGGRRPCWTERPTYDALARTADSELYLLDADVSSRHDHTTRRRGTRPRSEAVDRIMHVGVRLWDLVPLRRELRGRRALTMTATEVHRDMRIRADAIVRTDAQQQQQRVGGRTTYLREDVLDACMRRFGSNDAFQRYLDVLRDAARKRQETIQLRQSRRAEIEAATGEPTMFARLLAVSVDLSDAVRRYATTGRADHREAVMSTFWRLHDAIQVRRDEMRALPLPCAVTAREREQLARAMFVPQSVEDAQDEYAYFGGDKDLRVVRGFSARWKRVCDVWQDSIAAGSPDAPELKHCWVSGRVCIPMMPWVMRSVLSFLYDDDDDDKDDDDVEGRGGDLFSQVKLDRSCWDACWAAAERYNDQVPDDPGRISVSVFVRACESSTTRPNMCAFMAAAIRCIRCQLAADVKAAVVREVRRRGIDSVPRGLLSTSAFPQLVYDAMRSNRTWDESVAFVVDRVMSSVAAS